MRQLIHQNCSMSLCDHKIIRVLIRLWKKRKRWFCRYAQLCGRALMTYRWQAEDSTTGIFFFCDFHIEISMIVRQWFSLSIALIFSRWIVTLLRESWWVRVVIPSFNCITLILRTYCWNVTGYRYIEFNTHTLHHSTGYRIIRNNHRIVSTIVVSLYWYFS